MQALVLSKIAHTPVQALVLDKQPVPPYTAAVSAKFYWRFEDEPESNYQYLGQQSLGSPLAVPFEAAGRTVRISMIGVAANGVQSTYDPREGVQTTIAIPSGVDSLLFYGGLVVEYPAGVPTTYG